ncbi:MAG TPA: GDSL-type esterase/lipase family protein [Anaerolineales bacterium]|jgi:lysophospholipase L1-like esterase|nr:GDSL-type esterase/lipase family protein [Anaerolineales bacterium]
MKISNRGLLINVSLFIFSTIFALVLSEIGLRLTGFSPLYVSPERDRFWKYDSLLGWAHEAGQDGIFETPQFRTFVRINDKGLRDRSHSYERQNDTERILVLGDSFAWGYGVEEEERFSQLLEKLLDAEVINAGVSGYSTDQELLWYKNEGIKYETDLVIVVFAGNDIGDNEKQLVNNIYYKPQFVIDEGGLVLTNYPVPKTSPQGRFIYSLSKRSALAYFLTQRYFDIVTLYRKTKVDADHVNVPGSGVQPEKKPFELTIALMHEMRQTAESRGAKFLIVATDSWWNYPSKENYENFLTTMRSEGFLVLDVESMPGFSSEDMLIPDDGHWNQSGHKFVAAKIKDFIEVNQLLIQVNSK